LICVIRKKVETCSLSFRSVLDCWNALWCGLFIFSLCNGDFVEHQLCVCLTDILSADVTFDLLYFLACIYVFFCYCGTGGLGRLYKSSNVLGCCTCFLVIEWLVIGLMCYLYNLVCWNVLFRYNVVFPP